MSDSRASLLVSVASLAFVLMWSTGHIMTKLGDPYIEPFRFLAIRFALSAALLIVIAAAFGARWPSRGKDVRHTAIAGILVHAIYLGGVFVAIDLNLSAGALGVITGIQPLLTAAASGAVLGERVTARQWVGLALGLVGVSLVVWEKATLEGTPASAFIAAFICLFAITAGTLYQKKFCGGYDLFSSAAIQLTLSAAVCTLVSLTVETGEVIWAEELIFALGWQVVVLSVISFSLLYWLLRQDAAVRVTSLFYLTPPTIAVMGWFLFGETFAATGLAGMAAAVVGFWLVIKS